MRVVACLKNVHLQFVASFVSQEGLLQVLASFCALATRSNVRCLGKKFV